MAKKKQIAKNDITGDRGIAFIHRVVSDMAHLWTPKGLEAGIDGFIELRDDATSQVGARIIQVQSKAGESHFRSESPTEFTYYCDESDIDYWMQANTPVLLIVSRPERNEGFWVHVQGYFADPEKRKSRKIVFQKMFQRFDAHAHDAIERLATPANAAYHARIAKESETLWSNLCPLVDYPGRVFRAKTRLKSPQNVIERLNKAKEPRGREWLLHGGFIYSFDDLSFDAYRDIHYARVPDNLSTDDFSTSHDRDKRYVFTRLMLQCVKDMLYRQGIRYDRDKRCYYCRATDDLSEQHIGKLSVFKGYPYKKDPDRIAYYRHRAGRIEPIRIEGEWFLEITPTYHFTYDGWKVSRYYEDALSQIKIIERQNKTHLRQIRFWEEMLTECHINTGPIVTQQRLFDTGESVNSSAIEKLTERHGVLEFGSLVAFEADWKVPEKHWLAMGRGESDSFDPQLELF